MNQSTLKLALVGCGTIGRRHARLIHEKACLAAVCDIIPEHANALADEYGGSRYYSLEELLIREKEVEAIAICTPSGLHAVHSIQSLKANKHVLCEKPMALNVADCQAMIEASRSSKKKLVIIKQNRFNPPVLAVKHLLDKGSLGPIYSVHVNCFWNRDAAYYNNGWRGTKKMDGGTLFTQFSHFIDLLAWLVGDLRKVSAFVTNAAHQGIIEFEDCGSASLEFENGVLGSLNFTINSFGKNMEGSITIFGEKGTVKIGGAYLNKLEYQCLEEGDLPETMMAKPPNQYEGYSGSMSNHDQVYDNFLKVIQEDAGEAASAWDGLKTVEMIEKIYKSAVTL